MDKQYLYQPTGVEGIDNSNSVIIVRKCSDRLEAMISFSQEYFGKSLSEKTFMDIGSSYGYFVNGFNKHCGESFGIDKDRKAILSAEIFYPEVAKNIELKIFPAGVIGLTKYNIVSFLSVLQHFIFEGHEEEDLIKFIKVVDDLTEDILFFEMGEDHESWYEKDLFGWNVKTISEWILENTTFDFCVPLIKDGDSIEEFSDKYGRTVFACYRK